MDESPTEPKPEHPPGICRATLGLSWAHQASPIFLAPWQEGVMAATLILPSANLWPYPPEEWEQ